MKDDRNSFRALVGAQFLGAFNDNLFKQLILFLAAGYIFKDRDVQGLAFAVFALPFVVFSGMAGDLSERFSKRTIIFNMKLAEIGVMLLGVVAFMLLSWHFMLVVLFLMGLQSAFFGPSKYGVIPELIGPNRLLRANGSIAMTTFMGVLLGQALAGPLLDSFDDRLWVPGIACIVIAAVGTLIARRMSRLAPQNPAQSISPSPFGSLFKTIGTLRKRQGLFRFVLLYSLFWFNGGVVQQAIVSLGESRYLDVGVGEKTLLSYLLVTLSVAIILGSICAPIISKWLVRPGRTIILGAVGMATGQLALLSIGAVITRAQGGLWLAHGILAWIGFSGAMFVVPIQTYLQHAPEKGKKGQTFAVNNFMNFLFIFLAGVYYLAVRSPQIGLGPTWAQALAGFLVLGFLLLNRGLVAEMTISDDR